MLSKSNKDIVKIDLNYNLARIKLGTRTLSLFVIMF